MEHILLVDPIGKLPEKPVCLKRLSSLTGWDFSTGLFRSIHILLGFPSSSRSYDIFPFLSDLMGNGKRVLRTGFANRNFCVPFAQFEIRWVFDVNGKQPLYPLHRHPWALYNDESLRTQICDGKKLPP